MKKEISNIQQIFRIEYVCSLCPRNLALLVTSFSFQTKEKGRKIDTLFKDTFEIHRYVCTRLRATKMNFLFFQCCVEYVSNVR